MIQFYGIIMMWKHSTVKIGVGYNVVYKEFSAKDIVKFLEFK